MVDFIVATIHRSGYLGIALLMFLENIFPPLPSEIIMPFAGFVAAQGKLSPAGVVASGTAGSVAGAYLWYALARSFGERRVRRLVDRYGRWMTVTNDEVSRAKAWFERYDKAAVFFGRLMPAIRTLISVPAGLARMPPTAFLALTTAGSALWVIVLVGLGFVLSSQYRRVADFIDPITNAILVLIVIAYIYRLVTYTAER